MIIGLTPKLVEEIAARLQRPDILGRLDEAELGELAGAGAAHAINSSSRLFPWCGSPIDDPHMVGLPEGWKWEPGTERDDLITAMEFLVAEIARFEKCSNACRAAAAAAP